LVEWSRAPELGVRCTALAALGWVRPWPPGSLEALRGACRDANPEVRRAALAAIRVARDQGLQLRPEVDGLVGDEDETVRRMALEVAALLGARERARDGGGGVR
jgi:hypothetical protein